MKKYQITAYNFKKMLYFSLKYLKNNIELINNLNVFPIPDGDTGVNMYLSFKNGFEYVNNSTSNKIGKLLIEFSQGLLMGARGNSGVILSQLFRGFSKRLLNYEVLDSLKLSYGFEDSIKSVYDAVINPIEGTILTIVKDSSNYAINECKKTNDCILIMKSLLKSAKISLKNTPNLLKVLKESNVVDSGGQGLVLIYEGFVDGLINNEKKEFNYINNFRKKKENYNIKETYIKFRYCTEILIKINIKKKEKILELKKKILKLGNSLVFVYDEKIIKIHIHTEKPGNIIELSQEIGELFKIKIDNMKVQHKNFLKFDNIKKKKYFIISMVNGDGLIKIFKNLGSNYVINKIKNINIKKLLSIINKIISENILIIPNDKNLLLLVYQILKISKKNIIVIPTKNISEGINVLNVFNKKYDIIKNKKKMINCIKNVLNGKISIATKDACINSINIKKNEYLGLINEKIVISNIKLFDVLYFTLNKMINIINGKTITIFVGKKGNMNIAKKLLNKILIKNNKLNIEICFGGQPIYLYIFSVYK